MVWRDLVIDSCVFFSAILQALGAYGDGKSEMNVPSTEEAGCSQGWWGEQCQQKCHCLVKTEQCHEITGHCQSGCPAGYRGSGCKQQCTTGWYGINCSVACGQCYAERCNPFTGACPAGCHTNWTGALCKTYCSEEKDWCPAPCGQCLGGAESCDQSRGVCRGGCLPGWTGLDCNISCPQGVWGEGCRTACGRCEGGANNCHALDLSCKEGCQLGFSGDSCNTEEADCSGLQCRCGECWSGSDGCDVISGTCRDGCRTTFTGKACQTECGERQHEEECEPCLHCPCGCNISTRACLSCNPFLLHDSWLPVAAMPLGEQHHKEPLHFVWIASCAPVLTVIVLMFSINFTRRLSTLSRERYVRAMFNRLTADDAFRFINPPLVQRTRRVKEPQFDVKSLSVKEREDVLRELDCLLDDRESYEDFVRSPRYKELRVLVANKAWATDRLAASALGHKGSRASPRGVISRWKLRLSRSLGTPVDLSRWEAGNGTAPPGILKDRASHAGVNQESKENAGGRLAGHNVRFSSAASMVIFPVINSSSSSVAGGNGSSDTALLHSVTKVLASQAGTSSVVTSPSGVDISCDLSPEEEETSESRSSFTVPLAALAPVKGNSDTVLYAAHDDTLRFAARDPKFLKRNEKRDISKNALSLCDEGSCCLHAFRRTFANIKDDVKEDKSSASLVSENEVRLIKRYDSVDERSQKNCPLRTARDSLMLIPNPKMDEEGDGVD